MNDLVIDAFEFCRVKGRREGEMAVAELPRLAAESVDGAGKVGWVLQGGSDKRGHPSLSLFITGSVVLLCQRCLTPFAFDVNSASTLILAPDEAAADEMDAQLEDEDVEVIVGSHSFDVTQLVEDEALLAIPLSPKHEVCPGRVEPEVVEDVKKESPFAVLKNLKR